MSPGFLLSEEVTLHEELPLIVEQGRMILDPLGAVHSTKLLRPAFTQSDEIHDQDPIECRRRALDWDLLR